MSPIEYGLEDLAKTFDLRSFAKLIGAQPMTLAYILYKLPDQQKYFPKKIPKKMENFVKFTFRMIYSKNFRRKQLNCL